MHAHRKREKNQDIALQRIQGVHDSVPDPAQQFRDKKQSKLSGNQAQLLIEFAGSQQQVKGHYVQEKDGRVL